MRIGPLRHRVTIQSRARYLDLDTMDRVYGTIDNAPEDIDAPLLEGDAENTVDGYGAPVDFWADLCTVWASIDPVNGRELFASRQTQSEATQKIRIRYRDDVTPDCRIVHGTTIYNITAVLPDNRRSYLLLLCREASYEQEKS